MTLAALLDQLAPDAIERACACDRDAMEALVSTMQRPFYNLALRMLGDRSLAEDAAQECLLRVVTHLSEFRGEARFATWATRIALNATLDFRSGLARAARLGFDDFAARLSHGLDEHAPDRPEVIGVNYFCRLATTILAGPTGGSRGVDLGGVVVVAG